MAKKSFFSSKAAKPVTPAAPVVAPVDSSVKSTVSRGSPVPKVEPRREVTREMIAVRAFEIYVSGRGSNELGNWLQAERELKAR